MRRKSLALLLGLCTLLAACGSSHGDVASTTPTPVPDPTVPATTAPAQSGNVLTGVDNSAFFGKRPVAISLRMMDSALPLWGIADADVLVMGVTEGQDPALMALYPCIEAISQKVGPVGSGRDLTLQFALPLNAVPVHIAKNIYAANLLNALCYQDLDGCHIGKTAFAFDAQRYAAGYREENCFYTSPDLLRAGMDFYGGHFEGESQNLFNFIPLDPATQSTQNAHSLDIGFSETAHFYLDYDQQAGRYKLSGPDHTALAEEGNGNEPSFTNVFILYASSGVKDDGYTRQYDLTQGEGLYLTSGAWSRIRFSKSDATAPLLLFDESGGYLPVNPGRSYIAIWGGYSGQDIRVMAQDGSVQALPEKPTALRSGASDDASTTV